MKRNKMIASLLGTVLASSILLSMGETVSAATFSGSSDASVSFGSGSLVTPPVTPPITPPVTPPASNFGLLYVPTEFNFQETAVPTVTLTTNTSIPIDSNWEGSPASNTGGSGGTNTTTKHVGVGDVRGQRAAGWKLEAKLSAHLTSGSGATAKPLTGATIQMSQSLNALNPTTWAKTPTTVGSGVHAPDTVPTSVTIGTASSVVASASDESASGAADGRGEGYWETEYTNINLVVPAAVMNNVLAGEQYSGTVEWTLTDGI